MSNDVMIDLETLGTGSNAIILAIGAVKFDLEKGTIDDDGFYASISVESNQEIGREMDESTLLWWLKQSPDAQAVFHEPKVTITSALEDFAAWMGHAKRSPWGNGPAFDLVKVATAYRQIGMDHPWEYWNERCVRTYRALPGAAAIPKVKPLIAHNAIHDAVAQAQHVINIHQALFKAPAKSKVKA